ncbi:MAG: TetR/AcrR family transcriptional regulator [Spirochaetales bacterium]|nr:TetR/AcrR family transcriptional regulator [Spirochaetales bacterium]
MARRQNSSSAERSRFTKDCIVQSLLNLMDEQSFPTISIQEIVDTAGVSRMAYYRNFSSKEDILRYHIASITDDFISKWESSKPKNFQEYLVLLFDYLLEQKEFGLKLVKAGMIVLAKDAFDKGMLAYANDTKGFYNMCFFSGGLFNMYKFWLENGCRETPKQLSEFFAKKVHLFNE